MLLPVSAEQLAEMPPPTPPQCHPLPIQDSALHVNIEYRAYSPFSTTKRFGFEVTIQLPAGRQMKGLECTAVPLN